MPAKSAKNRTNTRLNQLGEQPLVVYGFSPAQVFVQGTQIRDWRTAKASELLFLMLDRAKPLRKETIIDVLWPELYPAQADNLFRSTLFRLRKATSAEWIKRVDDSYIIDVPYWYDAEQFEQLLRQGDKLSTVDKGQALESYHAATGLYRGVYLENFYSDWCIERQEHLATLQIGGLLKQAELELQLNMYDEVLASVEQCLQLDKCNEPAYLIQLRTYQQLGKPSLLTHAYQNYCQTISKELNLEPSSEAKLFYTKALASFEKENIRSSHVA
jgi:two-component SAPR family response regulator